MGLAHVLKGAQLVPSTSEAMRQVKQGAVRVDGERVEDAARRFAAGNTHVFQVGKRRLARVTLGSCSQFLRSFGRARCRVRARAEKIFPASVDDPSFRAILRALPQSPSLRASVTS